MAANTFTEAGYTFAGWSDGSATYAGRRHLHLGLQRLGHRLDRHLDGQRHRRLLLRRGHRQRQRPGRGQRARRHQRSPWPPTPSPSRATPSPGGPTAAPPTRRRHLHLGLQRLGHRLDRHLDGQRHRRLLLRRGHRQRAAPRPRAAGSTAPPITLAANTFTEAGYTFAGWSDGSATYAGGRHLHLGLQRLGHRLDRHLDGQRHRRLLLRRGHRQGQRPGRGQRARRHHRSPWPPTPSPRRATPSPGGATAAPPTPPAPPTPWPPTARPSC